jgi:hypothetical protein
VNSIQFKKNRPDGLGIEDQIFCGFPSKLAVLPLNQLFVSKAALTNKSFQIFLPHEAGNPFVVETKFHQKKKN